MTHYYCYYHYLWPTSTKQLNYSAYYLVVVLSYYLMLLFHFIIAEFILLLLISVTLVSLFICRIHTRCDTVASRVVLSLFACITRDYVLFSKAEERIKHDITKPTLPVVHVQPVTVSCMLYCKRWPNEAISTVRMNDPSRWSNVVAEAAVDSIRYKMDRQCSTDRHQA